MNFGEALERFEISSSLQKSQNFFTKIKNSFHGNFKKFSINVQTNFNFYYSAAFNFFFNFF